MPRKEIRITGYGGQGVILTGYIFGKAAAIFGGLHSTMTQSFGPEARGSACASALVVDDDIIAYPYMRDTDILIALSREGYEKYADELSDDGILVFDADLVTPHADSTAKTFGIQAARLAEELGNRIVQNIVVVGFTTAVTGIIDREAVAKAVESSVPGSTIELNLKAFATGYEEGQKLLAPVG
jgi:2-oxoglutarate ferredoxin oxidoreductase subunit gamma